jgi:hypothetical protein
LNGDPPNVKHRRPKTFSLKTYKTHALGDYVACIKRYGTTDSYTTAIASIDPLSLDLEIDFVVPRENWSIAILKLYTSEPTRRTMCDRSLESSVDAHAFGVSETRWPMLGLPPLPSTCHRTPLSSITSDPVKITQNILAPSSVHMPETRLSR